MGVFVSENIPEAEYKRLSEMSIYEKNLRKKGFENIAGVDEAGRGPLAGPVVAAACILKDGFVIPDLNDSKKLSPKKRKEIYKELITSEEVVYSVGIVDEKKIDEINILQATFLAMQHAVSNLKIVPSFILVDGNKSPDFDIDSKCIVKGDSLSISIAAASIIAKTLRDEIMERYHDKWPLYEFNKHKGYGTKRHRQAIADYGFCDIHRKSFEPIKSMILTEEDAEQASFFRCEVSRAN